MFDCKISLCAFLYSTKTPNFFVVSSTAQNYSPLIYSVTNNDLSIKDAIYNLIDEFIGINPQKLSIMLRDVEKIENSIILHHVCNLPIDCRPSKAYNIPYQFVMGHPIIKKSIAYA